VTILAAGERCEVCAGFDEQVAAPVAERIGPAHYHDSGRAIPMATSSATALQHPSEAAK
jgi:hypothetical protein